MNLVEYAKNELDRLLIVNENEEFSEEDNKMQMLMNDNILDLIRMFSEQGHSGFSANYLIQNLKRLMSWKPIQPLTGEDDEWEKCDYLNYDESQSYQNKRCNSVFKTIYPDGTVKVHDNDSVICSDNGGITWFQGYITKQWEDEITFPYCPPDHPKEVYIEYTEEVPLGETGEKFDIITGDKERIKKLHDKMRKVFDELDRED